MVRGRRTKVATTIFDLKRDECLSSNPKRLLSDFTIDNTLNSREMTRRSAKFLNANKSQNLFHDQTITKYFHVQQKLNENRANDLNINDKSSIRSLHDNDENTCDAFMAALKMPTYQTFEDVCNSGMQQFSVNHDNNVTDILCTVADQNLPFSEEINNFTNGNDIDNESHDESDRNSVTSIEPSNIFLQKPVLHLDIDKSPNQASSIIINKHLEVCPNFAPTLNSFTGTMVSKSLSSFSSNGSSSETPSSADDAKENDDDQNSKKAKKTAKRRRLMKTRNSNHFDGLLESDSNSCDSGVVADKSLEMNEESENKPTTPHRILCPSISPVNKLKPERTDKVSALQNVRSSLLGNRAANQVSALKRATIQKRKPIRRPNQNQNLLKFAIKSSSDTTTSNKPADQSNVNEQKPSGTPTTQESVPISRPPSAMAKVNSVQTKQMTDYFPVRRSIRKTKRAVEQEHLRYIEIAIEKQCEDGLAVKTFKDKGRGIIADRPFNRGEFVVEYIGDLIDHNEADRREEIYAKDAKFGCYMYYFKHKEQHWCIDATAETGKLGRLVNHSRNGNLMTKIVTYKNRPHLVLLAKDDIQKGEELTYDYGDRTRESIANYPWLAL